MLLFIGTAAIAYILAFVAVYFRSFSSFSFLVLLFIFSFLSMYKDYTSIEIAPSDYEMVKMNYV